MKNYEITFITVEDLKDKPAKEAIEKFGGKILKTDSLGEKQFAYKIEKKSKGFYTSAIFEMSPEKITELNKVLTLDEEIIRFLLISAERSDFTAPERKFKETALEKPKTELEIPTTEIIKPPLGMQTEPREKETTEKEVKKEKKITPVVKKEKVKEPIVKKVPLGKHADEPEKIEKPDKQVEEITSQEATEEERLKALDKKLDELLKE